MLSLHWCVGFSLVAASEGYSLLAVWGFHCSSLFPFGAWALGFTSFSNCGSRALEHTLNSCSTGASLLRGKWDLPGPGMEATSPTLAGRFFSTEPPGKSLNYIPPLFIVGFFFFFVLNPSVACTSLSTETKSSLSLHPRQQPAESLEHWSLWINVFSSWTFLFLSV